MANKAHFERLRDPSELNRNDTIIFFFGDTGTGKTEVLRFLISVTTALYLRHPTRVGQLKPQTEAVQAVRIQVNGRSIVLVDTPGFDNANLSDAQVLSMILPWLKHAYKIGVTVQKALYVHRISDTRVNRRTLGLLMSIAGEEFTKQMILVTTMWNTLPNNEMKVALAREASLKLSLKHAKPIRFDQTHDSAVNLLQEIVTEVGLMLSLSIQKGLVDGKLHLRETPAGQYLCAQGLVSSCTETKYVHDRFEKTLPQGEMFSERVEEEAYNKRELNKRFDKMARVPLRWKMKVWFKNIYTSVMNGTDLL